MEKKVVDGASVIGFSNPVDTDTWFLTLSDAAFRKGELVTLSGKDKNRVVRVYPNNWFTRTIDRFATWLKNRTRIVDGGVVIEIKCEGRDE